MASAIAAMTKKTIRYSCLLTDGARRRRLRPASLTIACVRRRPNEPMTAIEIPPDIAVAFSGRVRRRGLKPLTPEATFRRPSATTAPSSTTRQGRRLAQLLTPRSTGANLFYTRKLDDGRPRRRSRCDSPTTWPAAAHDEGRARRRSGSASARGARRSPSRSSATRATTRRHRPPDGRCAGSTPTRAGSGCSTAGRPSIAPRTSDPAIGSSSRSRSDRSWGSGRRSMPPVRSARTPFRPAACRASSAWR